MKATMEEKLNGLAEYHAGLTERAKSMRSFLNRNIFRIYQKAQARRWMTENDSEGAKWLPVTIKYGAWKRVKYADFPGRGVKLMIATGKLMQAATGQTGFVKVATDHSLYVALQEAYIGGAKYATIDRPVMKFGPGTIREMREAIKNFMVWGNL